MTTDTCASMPMPQSREPSLGPATDRPRPVALDRPRSVADVVGAATTATPATPIKEGLARRHRRQNIALLVGASVLGLWLGTGAPGVSPVGPAPPTIQAAAGPVAIAPPSAAIAPSPVPAAPHP